MLQRVSDRWSEYGFGGSSPVADMIVRLTSARGGEEGQDASD